MGKWRDRALAWRKATRAWLLTAFGAALFGVVVVYWWDPFGFSQATDLHGKRLFYQTAGTQYPAPTLPAANDGSAPPTRLPLSVIVLSDSDLGRAKEVWPPSYGLHADVLEALLDKQGRSRAGRPSSVFLDFVFLDRRNDPSLCRLLAVLADYRALGVRVAIGAPYAPVPGTTNLIRPEFLNPADTLESYAEGCTSEQRGRLAEIATPLVELVSIPGGGPERDGLDYPAVFGARGFERPSAAFHLFRQHCQHNPRTPTCRALDQPDADMEVMWGTATDARITCQSHQCTEVPASRLGSMATQAAHGVLGSLAERLGVLPMMQTAPYARTFLARDVVEEMPSVSSDEAGLIDGHIVLYGADVVMSGDVIRPPTHTGLAGVHLHAMALDNLLTLGPDGVVRPEPPVFGRWGARAIDVALLVLVIGVHDLMLRAWPHVAPLWRRGKASAKPGTAFELLWNVLVMLMFSKIADVEFQHLHASPLNWLGLSLFAAGAPAVRDQVRSVAAAAWRLPRWLADGVGRRARPHPKPIQEPVPEGVET